MPTSLRRHTKLTLSPSVTLSLPSAAVNSSSFTYTVPSFTTLPLSSGFPSTVTAMPAGSSGSGVGAAVGAGVSTISGVAAGTSSGASAAPQAASISTLNTANTVRISNFFPISVSPHRRWGYISISVSTVGVQWSICQC